jgi:hypothetical protein
MTDGEMKFPDWQIPFHQVLAESDTGKLAEKIQELDAIIFKRLQQLRQDPPDREERDALNDALSSLRSIKRDKLGFPDWN